MEHYISLGAGVQSSTMALMAAAGEITPMPEAAIFADTRREPATVYRWLDWLETKLPYPVHRVTKGDLRDAALTPHTSKEGNLYYRTVIPFHTKGVRTISLPIVDENDEVTGYAVHGTREVAGRIPHRTCTRDYKIRPIMKALRRLASVPRGAKAPVVASWIGISLDEMARMKPSRDPWCECRWPLVELRMSRVACLEWMNSHGFPEPPRSACVFCPFRSDEEWRRLKMTDPEGFADAVAFDAEARRIRRGTTLNSEAYLHRSLVPLDQVDFRNDTDKGQLLLWQDECSGMCGV